MYHMCDTKGFVVRMNGNNAAGHPMREQIFSIVGWIDHGEFILPILFTSDGPLKLDPETPLGQTEQEYFYDMDLWMENVAEFS